MKTEPASVTDAKVILGLWGFLIIVFLAAFLLPGCAATNGVETTKIVKEYVPVAVQPIKASDIPPLPAPLGARPPSAQQAADAAFAAHCRDIAWIIKAFPLLLTSAGLPPAQAPAFPECKKR